jgi:predicted DNA-binding transcriptional regulator YafY
VHHDRLDRLAGLLRARTAWTAAALARELDVSVRTIRRDLATLTARGAPLVADRGRGGGVRMESSWGVRRLELTPRETLDLLLALAVAESLRSPMLLAGARALRQKVALAFPPEERRRVNALRRRVHVGPMASAAVQASLTPPRAAPLASLQEAFFAQRVVELRYHPAGAEPTTRVFEPHHLLLNWPAWYALGWDHLRGAPRTLRVDRIERCVLRDETFALRPPADLLADVERFFGAL